MGLIDNWLQKRISRQLQTQFRGMFSGEFVNSAVTYAKADKHGTIEEGFLTVSTLYSIITICCRKFASVPFYAYQITDEKSLEKSKRLKTSGEIWHSPRAFVEYRKLRTKALQEIEGGDLVKFIKKPGNYTESFFRQQFLGFKMITGDTFFRINQGQQPDEELTDKIKPVEFELLSAPHMNLLANRFLDVVGYRYDLGVPPITFEPSQIVHWKYPNYTWSSTGEHLYGLSPIKAGNKEVTAATHNKTAEARMYEHSGTDGLIVRNEEAPITLEQRDDIMNRWEREGMNTSEGKGRKFMTNVNVRWEQMGMSAVDMNLIEGKKSIKEDLCNIYNFPINLLNNDRTTDNNYRHALKYLVTNTLADELEGYSDLMTDTIQKFWGEGIHYGYDVTELPEMQDDIKSMAEALDKMPYVTWNEKRVALKYDELALPYMDEPLVPAGLVPISELGVGMVPPDANTSDYNA